jgi:hypothetical protein
VVNCEKPVNAGGFCGMHYAQNRKGNLVDPFIIITTQLCGWEGCDNVVASRSWVCAAHSRQLRKYDYLWALGTCRDCGDPWPWTKLQCSRCDRCTERSSAAHLRHGISSDQFADLLDRQNGLCAVCASPSPGPRGTWYVDHDHKCCPSKDSCGKCVRGLLCQKCNSGLGMFNDDADTMFRAWIYLVDYENGDH